MEDNNNRKKAYDRLSEYYNMPSFEEFEQEFDDDAKQKQIYDRLSEYYNMPSYEEFSDEMRVQPQQPQGAVYNPATTMMRQRPGRETSAMPEDVRQRFEQQERGKTPAEVKQERERQQQAQQQAEEKARQAARRGAYPGDTGIMSNPYDFSGEAQNEANRRAVRQDAEAAVPYVQPAEVRQSVVDQIIDEAAQEMGTAEEQEQRRKEQRNLQAKNLVGQVDEMSKDIDEQIARVNREIVSEAQQKESDLGFWGRVGQGLMQAENPSRTGGIENMYDNHPEMVELMAAKRSLETTQNIITEAEKAAHEGKFENFTKSFGRGFGQKLSDVGTWDLGISEAKDNTAIFDALSAWEEGKELTPSQQALLDAKVVELAVNEFFGSEVGRGYKAGQSGAQMIPYFIEFAANPIAGAGRGAAKTMAKYALKRFGRRGMNSLLKRGLVEGISFGGRIGGSAVGGVGMAATTGGIRVAADAQRRMTATPTGDYDEEGNLRFSGADYSEVKKPLEAVAIAFGEAAKEYFTEMFLPEGGIALGRVLRLAAKTKAGSRFGMAYLNNLYRNVSANKFVKGINEIERRAQFQGAPQEYIEEIFSGLGSAAISGDQKLVGKDGKIWNSSDKQAVFNQDNLIDIGLGVGPMSLLFPFAKTFVYVGDSYVVPTIKTAQFKRNARKMLTQADEAGLDAFGGDQMAWGGIRNTLAFGNEEDVKNTIRAVMANNELTDEQKRAAWNYAGIAQGYRGVEDMYDKMMADVSDPAVRTAMDALNTYESAYDNAWQPSTRTYINMHYNETAEKLRGMLDEQTMQRLEEDPVGVKIELEEGGEMSDDQRIAVAEYVAAKSAMDGINDRIDDDAEAQAEQKRQQWAPRRNDNGGGFVRMTMKDNGEDVEVWWKDGVIAMNEDGSIDTENSDQTIIVWDEGLGRNRMVSPQELTVVESRSDADVERQIEAEKRSQIQYQRDQAQGKIVVGQTFPMQDGVNAKVTDINNNVITYQRSDGQVGTMPLKETQAIVDAAIQEQYRQQQEAINKRNTFYHDGREFKVEKNNGKKKENTPPPAAPVDNGAPKVYEPGMKITIKDEQGNERQAEVKRMVELTYHDGKAEYVESPKGKIVEYEVDGELRHDGIEKMKKMIVRHEMPMGFVNGVSNMWGNVYQWTTGKLQEAFDFLLGQKGGVLQKVFHRNDIGDIGLIWGNEKAGLEKIIEKHIIEHSDFENVEELADLLEETILNGTAKQRSDGRWEIMHNGYLAIIAKDDAGNWVLTFFDNTREEKDKLRSKEEQEKKRNELGLDSSLRPNEADKSGEVGTTFPPTEDISDGKDTNNSETEQEKNATDGESDDVQPEDKVQMPTHKVKRTINGEKVDVDEEDFEKVPEEATYKYLYEDQIDEDFTLQDADALVARQLAQARTNQKAAEANKAGGVETVKMRKRAARQSVEYWEQVAAMRQAVVDAEKAEAAAQRRAELEEQNRKDAERHEQAVAQREADMAEAEAKRAEQERTGANAAQPIVRDRWNAAPKVEGYDTEFNLPNGETIDGRYVLVESGAATPSHDPNNNFESSEGYPVDANGNNINDRDYQRSPDAMEHTRTMAANYDGRALQSIPVVSREGVVLSGNGRTMAGMLAAQNGTDGVYKEKLKKRAREFGFTPEQVEAMQHPRVVFVPKEDMPYTTETLAKFNESNEKQMSPVEKAFKYGKMVDDDTFSRIMRHINGFTSLAEFYADRKATDAVLGEMITAGIYNKNDVPSLYDGEKLSESTKADIESILIGKFFEKNPDMVNMIVDMPSVRQKVVKAMQEIADNANLGEEYSLQQQFADAVKLVYDAKNTGSSVADHAKQFGIDFETGEVNTAADINNLCVLMLSDVLSEKSVNRLKDVLTLYNDRSRDASQGQGNLFAENDSGVQTREEILKEVLNTIYHGRISSIREEIGRAVGRRQEESRAQAEPAVRGLEGQPAGEPAASATEQPAGEVAEQPKENYRQQAEKAIADILDGVERGGNGPVVSNEMTEAIQRIADMGADAEERLEAGVDNADEKARLEAQRDAAEKWLDENVRSQKANEGETAPTEEQKEITKALMNDLNKAGFRSHYVIRKGQEILDKYHELVEIMRGGNKKSTSETGVPSAEAPFKAPVISEIDGAKIAKNLDTEIEKAEKISRAGKKNFIGNIAKVLKAKRYGSKSEYVTFETKNGEVTLRLADHSAKVSNFDHADKKNGVSIVISRKDKDGIINDGNAHIVEFFYPENKLMNSDGTPYADILRSIQQMIYSGEYKDRTGIAKRQEVNEDVLNEMRAYHGSAADFDKFSRDFIGTGEGNQAYGYGHYTTEVEGIGRTYAEAMAAYPKMYYKGGLLEIENIGLNINTPEEQLAKLVGSQIRNGKTFAESIDLVRDYISSGINFYSNQNDKSAVDKYQEMEKLLPSLKESDFKLEQPDRVLYTVDIPDDNGSNYLEWDKPISEEQLKRIEDGLLERGIPQDMVESIRKGLRYKTNRTGQYVYHRIADMILPTANNPKQASEFLHSIGFTGIKYPAQYRSGGREDNAKNYVIFDDNDLKITDKINFYKGENGDVVGFIKGEDIFIDPRLAKPDTPIHEYTHPIVDYLRTNNPQAWEKWKSLARNETDLIEFVKEKYPKYRDNEEKLLEEVVAYYGGRRGQQRIENEMREAMAKEPDIIGKARIANVFHKIKELVAKFWDIAKSIFAGSTKDIDKLNTMDDFADMTLAALRNHFNPRIKQREAEEKTLMGVHNISEEKLRKALKNGGFANPSMAVIDTKKGGFDSYGDISLIPKASLIDAETGRNAGTWAGDAWTPTYPQVEKLMSDEGISAYYKDVNAVSDDRSLNGELKMAWDNHLDGRNPDNLAYWFLKERGIEPEKVYFDSGYTEEQRKRFAELTDNGAKDFEDMTEEDRAVIISMMAEERGISVEELLANYQKLKEKNEELLNDRDLPERRKMIIQRVVDEVKKYGVSLSPVNDFMYGMENALRVDGTLDVRKTLNNASDHVQNNGLSEDFKHWLEEKEKKYGVKEMFFDGFTRDGDRKYLPNTLANASRMMSREADVNFREQTGFSPSRAMLLGKMQSLDDIRKNKSKLQGEDEDIKQRYEDASNEMFEVVKALSDMQKISDNPFSNVDYANARLNDALTKEDPIEYLNNEYGYNISKNGKFAKSLKAMVQTIEDLPAKYFETKFKRPVALDEFAVAVVPEGTSQDVVDALKAAGLDVRTYDGTPENRQAVTMEAVRGRDDIMFQKAGVNDSDATEPFKAPAKEQGEDMVEYAKRVAKDYEEFEERSRKDGGDRNFTERDKAIAAEHYERMLASGAYQFREAMQDSMLGLAKAYQAILGKNRGFRIEDVPGNMNAYLAENRMSSTNAAEQHLYFQQYMMPVLNAVSKIAGKDEAKRQELTDYMMAKHGLERNIKFAQRDALEASKNGADYGKALQENRGRDYAGLTALTGKQDVAKAEAAARKMVADYEMLHDTKKLWDAVSDANGVTLAKLYVSGILSKESYEQIRDMFEYYIPLRGFDQKTSDEVYGYLTSKAGPFRGGSIMKHAEGRSSKADDPIATMALMADQAIRQANRNEMKQKFLTFVQDNPSDLVSVSKLWLEYNKTLDEWVPIFPEIDPNDSPAVVEGKVAAFNERMEKLAEKNPDEYKSGADAAGIPFRVTDKSKMGEHQVLVKRGGETYVLTINGNPRAAQALNGLTNPDIEAGNVLKGVLQGWEKLNHNLSSFYTTRNPDFVASNFLRDTAYTNAMVWVKENPKYAANFHKNWAKVNPVTMGVLFSKWEKGTLDDSNELEHAFKQFMLNGGETGYTNIKDLEGKKKEIAAELKKRNNVAKNTADILGTQFDVINRAVENCARFAAFLTSREMGRSIERSIYDAKEISVNFNKKGAGGKMVDATGENFWGKTGSILSGSGRLLHVFWNAGVQGMTNFGRAFKRNPAKAIPAAATLVSLGYLLSLFNGSGDGDDDDKNAYYNLPEYIRRSNICIKAGDKWVTIPLPIEYRALYGLGELAAGVITGHERYTDKELARQVASQVSQMLPLDVLEGGGFKMHYGWLPSVITPSAIKPLIEASENVSWSGLPIYRDSYFNRNDPEWTKAYKNADKNIVAVTQWLNDLGNGPDYAADEKKADLKAFDLNPAKIEYMLKGYLGGWFTFPNQLVKSYETLRGNREFDWRNVPIANRVIKTGDERTEARKLQEDYFNLLNEYDVTMNADKKKREKADSGIVEKAEYITWTNFNDQYKRAKVVENFKPLLDALHDEKKNATEYSAVEVSERENELRRQLVDIVNAMADAKKEGKEYDYDSKVQTILESEFDRKGFTSAAAGRQIAKRMGGTDYYGQTQAREKQGGQEYYYLREHTDLESDVAIQQLSSKLNDKKDEQSKAYASDIDKQRDKLSKIKKELPRVVEDDGNVYNFPRYIQDPDTKEWVLMNSQDEVMAFYRAKRKELILDYYKPLFKENGIPLQ